MHDVAIFVPSYRYDIERVTNLVKTVHRYASTFIPICICVPEDDLDIFASHLAKLDCMVVCETVLLDCESIGDVTKFNGYLLQQVLKLNVDKLQIARNYLILDSDFLFISEFNPADFHEDEKIVLFRDNMQALLYSDPAYYARYGIYREKCLNEITNFYNMDRKETDFIFNTQIFSVEVLEFLRRDINRMKKTYANLIQIAPFEYAWYNAISQKHFKKRIIYRENPFFMIHTKQQYVAFKVWGIDFSSIQSNYKGILINSKIGRHIFKPFQPRLIFRDNNKIMRLFLKIFYRLL